MVLMEQQARMVRRAAVEAVGGMHLADLEQAQLELHIAPGQAEVLRIAVIVGVRLRAVELADMEPQTLRPDTQAVVLAILAALPQYTAVQRVVTVRLV